MDSLKLHRTIFDLDTIQSEDEGAHKNIFQSMLEMGYLLIKVSPKFMRTLDRVERKSRRFFDAASHEEKQMMCCEFVGQKVTSKRDRLEIRLDRATNTAFPALSRNQFASGFDSSINMDGIHVVDRYFGTKIIRAHSTLESLANRLLHILCTQLKYPHLQDLQAQLSQEKITPGVLRMMKYIPKIENGADIEKELAIDHTDIGLITIMPHADAESLQILSNGFEWINIEKGLEKDVLIVIGGEQLAFISNYSFQAVRHRVISNPSLSSRYSYPFLMRVAPDYNLIQIGSKRFKQAKNVLNHIFDLQPLVQTLAKQSLAIFNTINATIYSLNNDNVMIPVAAVMALPKPGLLLSALPDIWDLLIIFNDRIPTKSILKSITMELGCGYRPIKTKYEAQNKNAFNASSEPHYYKKTPEIWRTLSWNLKKEESSQILLSTSLESVSTLFRSTLISKSVFAQISNLDPHLNTETAKPSLLNIELTIKNSQVVYGRQLLEDLFGLNAYRIE